MKKIKIILLISIIVLLLAGCMAGTGRNTPDYKAGFFSGIWHGWIAPLALIGSIFNDQIKIYEVNNVGFWYELGFYIAIISGFGGISIFRRRNK